MAVETVDVCLVGCGATGGILAKQLGTAGLKVVAFERGAMLTLADYEARDAIRTVTRSASLEWARHDPITYRTRPDENAELEYHTVSAVGGQMLHWTAEAARFLPSDFRVHTDEVASGLADRANADLAGYEVYDWPFGYDDLEPYYERFEWEFGVSGGGYGANPFAGHRKRGYPLPGLRRSAKMELFTAAAKTLGYQAFDGAAGILSRAYRPPAAYDARIAERPACTYCAHCNFYGCHVQAKADGLYGVIPVALATGNVDLRTNTRVVRLNSDAAGRVNGVSFLGPDKEPGELRAKVVVLSGYAFENARLLLLSKLANSSGTVGHGIFGHGDINVAGVFDDYIVNGFIGPNTASTRVDELDGNNFDHTGLGFIRGAGIGTGGTGTPVERYNIVPPGTRAWGTAYKDFLAHSYTRTMELTIRPETLAHRDNVLDLDPTHTDEWGIPLPRLTFAFHQNEHKMWEHMAEIGRDLMRKTGAKTVWARMPNDHTASRWAGGTRMGTDSQTSVVDGYGRTHDVANLFVVGASTFPTLTGSPATETACAMAYRTADYLLKQRELFS